MGDENEDASPCPDSAGKTPTSIYEIRVKGCMDKVFWSDWFGDLDFTIDLGQGETCLRGSVADQAELYGLLSRLRNKGLTLVSVQEVHYKS
jgi:hypothetical protein